MGLLLTNKKDEISIGYMGFMLLRTEIAASYSKKTGELYKQMAFMPLKESEEKYIEKTIPINMQYFLFHSDCDGKIHSKMVKKIYQELEKIKVNFDGYDEDKKQFLQKKYKDIKELFSQNKTIYFE